MKNPRKLNKRNRESGMGAVEYCLLVALIALAGTPMISVVGKDVRKDLKQVHCSLGGGSCTSQKDDELY